MRVQARATGASRGALRTSMTLLRSVAQNSKTIAMFGPRGKCATYCVTCSTPTSSRRHQISRNRPLGTLSPSSRSAPGTPDSRASLTATRACVSRQKPSWTSPKAPPPTFLRNSKRCLSGRSPMPLPGSRARMKSFSGRAVAPRPCITRIPRLGSFSVSNSTASFSVWSPCEIVVRPRCSLSVNNFAAVARPAEKGPCSQVWDESGQSIQVLSVNSPRFMPK